MPLTSSAGRITGGARPGPDNRSGERGDQLAAGLLAPPARLGTDAAVLMHRGMLLTAVTARLAGCRTGLEESPREVGVVTGVARKRRAGRRADVRAIEIGADALGEI